MSTSHGSGIWSGISSRIFGHTVDDLKKKYRYYDICSQASFYVYESSRPDELSGWKKTHEGEEEVIYEKNSKRVAAFRGTAIAADYGTDLKLVMGVIRDTDRFEQSINLVKTFGVDIVCGHSLGGSIAIEVALDLDIPCYAFNPGIVPKKYSTYKHLPRNILIFRVKGDPISISASDFTNNVTEVTLKKGNPHSVANFI